MGLAVSVVYLGFRAPRSHLKQNGCALAQCCICITIAGRRAIIVNLHVLK